MTAHNKTIRQTYTQTSLFSGDSTLTFDPTAENGHPKAGWAALRLVGDQQVGLAAPGNAIIATLKSVAADGSVEINYTGFVEVREGDASVNIGAFMVGGSKASGALSGNGYISEGGGHTSGSTLVENADGNRSIIYLR